MVLYVALAVSAIVAARLVYRYDLYDREPWFVIAVVAAAGAVAMRLLGDVEDQAIELLAGRHPTAGHIAFVAAAFEESARLLIVLALAWIAPKVLQRSDGRTDLWVDRRHRHGGGGNHLPRANACRVACRDVARRARAVVRSHPDGGHHGLRRRDGAPA